jgi:lipopolysaccharide/colanic/teichoic acid biosynthesis glycosyltransferase
MEINEQRTIIKLEKIVKINKNFFYLFLKRTLDIFISLIALFLLLFPIIFVSILISQDKGPILFKQVRLGLNGKKFTLYKFRTMVINAEKNGFKWTEKNDPRITKVGKIIRKYRIDELPQFINIIMGSMSLVGPRPEVPYFYGEFEKHIHGFKQRLFVKPGLTGWAQVNGGYDLKPEEKIFFDLEYIKKQSLFFDFKVLFKTISVIINKDGAH